MLPETNFSRKIDSIVNRIGRVVSWAWLALLFVIVANVTLRYAFGEGRIEFEEIQWHLYSIGFLIGLSYAYAGDNHVRVDVLHEKLSPRRKAWVELYGILLLLLPFTLLVIVYSVPFVADSFRFGEISQAPGGLPYRWAIKAFLPAGFSLLLLATLARLSRVWSFLFLNNAESDGSPTASGANVT